MGNDAGSIITVLGAVGPEEAGFVLPHEHLVADFSTPVDVGPTHATARHTYELKLTLDLLGPVGLGARNRDNEVLDEAGALEELAGLRARGAATVVEVTDREHGRSHLALAALSRASNVHVVMSTSGIHAEDMVDEIEHGIEGIRAGIIGLGVNEVAAVEHAAEASLRTGAAIRVAFDEEIVKGLMGSGVAPGRIIVAHADGAALDEGTLERLLSAGVFVQFDGVGRIPSVYTEVGDHAIAARIVALASQGFGDRLLVSRGSSRKIDRVAYGGSGLGFIASQFLPYLSMLGASDQLAQQMTVTNPSLALALSPTEA